MKDLKVPAMCSEVVESNMNVEIELTELELAYVGGGIGDVIGH